MTTFSNVGFTDCAESASLLTLCKEAPFSLPSVISPFFNLYILTIYNYFIYFIIPSPFCLSLSSKSHEDFVLFTALSTVPRIGSGILWLFNLFYYNMSGILNWLLGKSQAILHSNYWLQPPLFPCLKNKTPYSIFIKLLKNEWKLILLSLLINLPYSILYFSFPNIPL